MVVVDLFVTGVVVVALELSITGAGRDLDEDDVVVLLIVSGLSDLKPLSLLLVLPLPPLGCLLPAPVSLLGREAVLFNAEAADESALVTALVMLECCCCCFVEFELFFCGVLPNEFVFPLALDDDDEDEIVRDGDDAEIGSPSFAPTPSSSPPEPLLVKLAFRL